MSAIDAADLAAIPLFDGLTADQLGEITSRSEEVRFTAGDVLFTEGTHADHWWVLMDGVVALSRRVGREDVEVARMDEPGRWAGGFRGWDASGVYLATGRGVVPGRALRLAADDLRSLLDTLSPLGGHLVRGLYHTARSVESTARQRDALVTLGTMAAGLAHELNNPAAAAVRSTDALAEACDGLLGALSRLAGDDISAAQFAALDELRQVAAAVPPPHDPLVLADREDELSRWLSARGIGGARRTASIFAASGIDLPWCDRAAEVLGEALGPGLDWVAATLSAQVNLARTRESTRRISELVASVRSYSQLDRASRQRTDLHEGLESTVTMLGHRLRDVDVVREFTSTVEIDAYPGELNQVWTNLITNAVDAMAGTGRLTLSTRTTGDGTAVVVEVVDTGTGMSAEVAERAFEPFFTTKDVGQGTGLGLDIARRIVVERHDGTIEALPTESGTTMRVTLPVEPQS